MKEISGRVKNLKKEKLAKEIDQAFAMAQEDSLKYGYGFLVVNKKGIRYLTKKAALRLSRIICAASPHSSKQ